MSKKLLLIVLLVSACGPTFPIESKVWQVPSGRYDVGLNVCPPDVTYFWGDSSWMRWEPGIVHVGYGDTEGMGQAVKAQLWYLQTQHGSPALPVDGCRFEVFHLATLSPGEPGRYQLRYTPEKVAFVDMSRVDSIGEEAWHALGLKHSLFWEMMIEGYLPMPAGYPGLQMLPGMWDWSNEEEIYRQK